MSLRATISDDIRNEQWDEFLLHSAGGHHVQTWEWAKVKYDLGWKPTRIIIEDDHEIVAGAQLLAKQMPLIGEIGYLTKGPVCKNNDPLISKYIIELLHGYIVQSRYQLMVVQPPNTGGYLHEYLVNEGFSPSFLELTPSASLVIDLSNRIEQIHRDLSRTAKNKINRARKTDLHIRMGNRQDLSIFHPLYLATARRHGFSPFSLSYFETLWDYFAPKGWIVLFIVFLGDGEPVSAHLLVSFGDTVISKKVGWSGKYSDLHPNDYLMWNCIEWAHQQGFSYFDLEGVNPTGARIRAQGGAIDRGHDYSKDSFKYSFGGQTVFYPEAYDLVTNGVGNWVYHRARKFLGSTEILPGLVDKIRNR